MENRIKVYNTTNAWKAEMVQMALRDEGIASDLDNLHQAALTGAVDVNVTVSEDDAEAAYRVIKRIDNKERESTLVVSAFADETTADEVQRTLQQAQESHLVDLNDSVVIIRNADGRVAIRQTHNLMQDGALFGGLCGAIVGAMFANPVIGLVAGTATGAAVGATQDIGINDGFLKEVGEALKPGTSALAVLVRRSEPEMVLPELEKFEGKMIRLTLLHTDEERFLELLDVAKNSNPS